MFFSLVAAVLVILQSQSSLALDNDKPNIVFVVADDLGWNDVGFHGSNQIPTPNIDALAYSGVILNRYYVNPVCSPSRSAILTGKYPIHTGMQHDVIWAGEPWGLPLNEKILPQYLKEMGYSTHAVGKWHLGFHKKEFTPLYRGFDSHLGIWTARHDYNDHTSAEDMWGLDMHRGMEPAWDLYGQYSTDKFTSEAQSIIRKHNKSSPLFLYLAHVAVHAGNDYNPHPAPDEVVAGFASTISNYPRRRFAAMLTKLDDSMGQLVNTLHEEGMLNNTIIVFTTDNGGPAGIAENGAASNWPLRGMKHTLWEGGVRGSGFLWTSSVRPTVSKMKVHITDWLPTLLSATNYSRMPNDIDGVDAWDTITQGKPSGRDEILHNIDPIENSASLTYGDWKIISGTANETWDQWFGPNGRDPGLKYDTDAVMKSTIGQILKEIGKPLLSGKMLKLRKKAEVQCGEPVSSICQPDKAPCLFNIEDDPCEMNNLAEKFPTILKSLERQLRVINSTMVPPNNKPRDPNSNPIYWDHTWTNWLDFPQPNSTTTVKPPKFPFPSTR